MNDPYLSSALNAISSGPAWRELADGPLAKRVAPKPVVIDLGRGPIQAMRERAALRAGFAEITEAVTGVPIIGPILGELITWSANLVYALGVDPFMDALRRNESLDGPTGTILDGFISGPIITWDSNPLFETPPLPSVTVYDSLASRSITYAGQLAGTAFADSFNRTLV
jgi:hypothetical protein